MNAGRILGALLLVVVVSGLLGNVFASRRRTGRRLSVAAIVRERLSDDPPRAAPDVWGSLAIAIRSTPRDGSTDLSDLLAAAVDAERYRPRLAADAEIREFALRWGNDYAMIGNPRELIYYRLHPDDLEIARSMDGTRTVKEIVVSRLQERGDLDIADVTELISLLREGNLLDPPFVDAPAAVRRAMEPATLGTRARRFAKTLTVEWRGADRLVRWFYRHGARWFFTPPVAAASGVIAALGFLAFLGADSERLGFTGESAVAESLIVLALSYTLTLAHELGHAVVLTHFGRRVKAAGFQIYFGSPTFFVESSDGLMLDRHQRILQAFAGPFAESILAGLAAIVAWAFPTSPVAGPLYKLAVLNYFIILLNLIPLLELDGYWMLSDLIQVPDLRPRSLAFLKHDLWPKLRASERLTRTEVGLGLYGLLGVAFTFVALGWSAMFWWKTFGSLIRALWDGGAVTRLLLVAIALVVLGPVLRAMVDAARAVGRRIRSIARRIRFRLQTGWRIEAGELIDALPVFEDLPEDLLSDLAGRVRLRSCSPGTAVVRQGERATAFYVVRRGRFEVIEEDRGAAAPKVLRTLSRGDSFGELGLLEGTARAATVRAVDESEVFEIDKGTFDRLLADEIRAPEFGPTLHALAELGDLPAFAHLGAAELSQLLEHGAWVNIAPGDVIVEQGEPGDAFYAVGSGQVSVIEDGEVVRVLDRGAYFGEVALLQDVPRTATVTARTPVRAFRLTRDGFDRLLGDVFGTGSLPPAARIDRRWEPLRVSDG